MMKRRKRSALVPMIAAVGLIASAVQPAMASDAKALHDEHCSACHDSSVYTRDNRRVGDQTALWNQVQRCTLSLGLQWFDDDIDAVSQYLNDQYYKFK